MKPFLSFAKFFAMLFVGTFLLAGCNKYLDKSPDKSLVVPSRVQDFQAILDNPNYTTYPTPSLDEASSDDYYLDESVYGWFDNYLKKVYTWEMDAELMDETYSSNGYNEWSQCYDQINIANIILENCEPSKLNGDTAGWENIRGQALFLRGQAFFELASLFSPSFSGTTASGDSGIFLKLSSSTAFTAKRSSLPETYSQIITDFRNASQLLPTLPLSNTRASKAASYAYISRVYLAINGFDSSYHYGKLALSIKSSLLDYNLSSDVDIDNLNSTFSSTNAEVIYQRYNFTTAFINTYPLYALVDTLLYRSYDKEDLRRSAFFFDNGGAYSFKGTYSGNVNYLFKGIATDELYLTCAECAARNGEGSNAESYLNRLLEKRFRSGSFVPYANTEKSSLLKTILEERRKELVFRSLRWLDLRRLNMEGYSIMPSRYIGGQYYELLPNSGKYCFPVPGTVTRINGLQ